MSEEQGQAAALRDEKSLGEQSPSEKLEGKRPDYETTPGAQNPESTEIKDESNPNTE